jgi:hypothetical protein
MAGRDGWPRLLLARGHQFATILVTKLFAERSPDAFSFILNRCGGRAAPRRLLQPLEC